MFYCKCYISLDLVDSSRIIKAHLTSWTARPVQVFCTPCHTIPPLKPSDETTQIGVKPTCQLTEMKPSAGGLRTSQTWSFATCRRKQPPTARKGKERRQFFHLPPHVFSNSFLLLFKVKNQRKEMCAKRQLGFEKRRWHGWPCTRYSDDTHTVRIWTWEPDGKRAKRWTWSFQVVVSTSNHS